jgi:hypothetical protein
VSRQLERLKPREGMSDLAEGDPALRLLAQEDIAAAQNYSGLARRNFGLNSLTLQPARDAAAILGPDDVITRCLIGYRAHSGGEQSNGGMMASWRKSKTANQNLHQGHEGHEGARATAGSKEDAVMRQTRHWVLSFTIRTLTPDSLKRSLG